MKKLFYEEAHVSRNYKICIYKMFLTAQNCLLLKIPLEVKVTKG